MGRKEGRSRMITSPGLIVACRSRANANSSTTNSSAANRRPAVSRRLIWTVSAASHLTASRCGDGLRHRPEHAQPRGGMHKQNRLFAADGFNQAVSDPIPKVDAELVGQEIA
jgi:hypothetical protein